MSCKQPCIGAMRHGIQLQRRTLDNAGPLSADPVHSYTTFANLRAAVMTYGGTNEYSKVVIGDTQATHLFTVRYTTLDFDSRDRIRDAKGRKFKILRIENVNEENRWLKLYCHKTGDETRGAAT